MKKIKEYLLYPILLVISVIALYQNVTTNQFSGLDDQLMIEENWDKLTHPNHAYTAFGDDVFGRPKGSYYRPIQVLSYMPDAYIINSPEPTPKIFFIINTLLFAFNAVLIFWFLGLFSFNQLYRFIFTFLYILHPVLTPGVAWIPGRVDIVLTILAIISLSFFIKFIRTGKFGWIFLHLLFFALSLFNKETSIVIPVISVLSVIYFSNFFSQPNAKFDEIKVVLSTDFWISGLQYALTWLKKNTIIVVGWVAITLLWYIMRKNALTDDPFSILRILHQLAFSWIDLTVLIGASVFPINLQVYLDISMWYFLWAIPGLVVFIYLPYKIKTPIKDLFFGYAWFVIFIYPTTLANLINYHRLAVPLIGLAFIFSPLATKAYRTMKVGFLTLAYSIFLLSQNLSFQEAFKTPISFWNNAIHHSPTEAMANNGLAWSYHVKHENDSAFKYYQQVLIYNPNNRDTRISMGLIAEEQGKHTLADSLLRSEFLVTYDSSFVYFYIGQIELERGDTAKALNSLQHGYSATKYSRNARLYYDTLAIELKNLLKLEDLD